MSCLSLTCGTIWNSRLLQDVDLQRRPEAQRTGVYFLLGDDPVGLGGQLAYVGEAATNSSASPVMAPRVFVRSHHLARSERYATIPAPRPAPGPAVRRQPGFESTVAWLMNAYPSG